MSGDIAAQGFRQVCADFKRKDTVQMIPIVIMAIEDESDRDYITGLFLKNERGMYAMALKIVKEHHTACDMVSESCLKMIEKIGYLREISVQKQTSYILSIVKNTSLMYLRQRHSENCYLVDDERILDCAATSQDDLDAALISEAESQVTLYKKSGSSWTKVTGWSDSHSGQILEIEKTRQVSEGTYKVVVTGTVTNSEGKKEEVKTTSTEMTYSKK